MCEVVLESESEAGEGEKERRVGAGVRVDDGVEEAEGFMEKMITRPSDPPVTRMLLESWTWQTRAVWPWRRAEHALHAH